MKSKDLAIELFEELRGIFGRHDFTDQIFSVDDESDSELQAEIIDSFQVILDKRQYEDGWTSLKNQIRDAISLAVNSHFDMSSKTHIFFHLGPGPEIKGFGDWPDQAYKDFHAKLQHELEFATPPQLNKWMTELCNTSETSKS